MGLQLIKARSWLTPEPDDEFDEKVNDINTLYKQAPKIAQNGEIVISTDEMTGVQAIERKHPGLPMMPGKVERLEFEYIRHGALSFIANFEMASGKIVNISYGRTRNECDFAEHIQSTVEGYPSVSKWHIVVDNLNIHKSESLVRYVAKESGLNIDLGAKNITGILGSMKTLSEFLSNSEHKIVFHYTSKHASWMNQIEIWFSILVRGYLKKVILHRLKTLKIMFLVLPGTSIKLWLSHTNGYIRAKHLQHNN